MLIRQFCVFRGRTFEHPIIFSRSFALSTTPSLVRLRIKGSLKKNCSEGKYFFIFSPRKLEMHPSGSNTKAEPGFSESISPRKVEPDLKS